MMFVFAIVTQYISYESSEYTIFEQFGRVFAFSLGGFDIPESGDERTHGEWQVFFILMNICHLLVLNGLIAIYGDSYDQV
jgi:hypothetical protein